MEVTPVMAFSVIGAGCLLALCGYLSYRQRKNAELAKLREENLKEQHGMLQHMLTKTDGVE
ncbi:hypothetical protein RI367_005071 [Sorochytrium milnesiophthora]